MSPDMKQPLQVISQEEATSSTSTLRDAIARGHKEVIVFGFKDGVVEISASKIESNFHLIGALEAAKMQIWGNA